MGDVEKDYRRDAIRQLFILVGGSNRATTPEVLDFPYVFKGEMRLQALDFWVRYPDYLADEILSRFEQTGDPEMLVAAREIFAADEPDVRKMPMMRKYYGAYEPLDTSLAILKSRGLVLPRTRKSPQGTNVRDFLLSEKAADTCSVVVQGFPLMTWYRERVTLVLKVADNRGGAALKQRQHQQKEYHDAQVGDTIPTIAERVKKRLESLGGL